MPTRKAAFIGSREWADEARIAHVLLSLPPDTVIVSGGARGADRIAEQLAKAMGMDTEIYPAQWRDDHGNYDRAAGFKRNREIVRAAGVVFAFWDGASPGTRNTISLAQTFRKPCYVFFP